MIWCCPRPFGRIVQRFENGRQQRSVNRMLPPSGDQSGANASSSGLVSRLALPPLTGIVQIADCSPPRVLSNAIVEPSGETRGPPMCQVPPISSSALPPPTLARSRLQKPNAREQRVKTTAPPSGVQEASRSSK